MTFADFIEIEMASILQDWEAFAATRLPAARGLSVAALRNDAENLLRCIADDMRSEQSELDRNDKGRGLRPDNAPGVTRFARCHAQLRLAQGFTLDQLVSEFRAVRASVVRRWVATAATGTSGALDALVGFGEAMDQSLTESVCWYGERMEASRTLLMGVLGHDLRNPLGAVRTSTVYLLRCGALDDAQTRAATTILDSTTRMRQLVHDLLDFASTRRGTVLPITRLPADLGTVCRRAVDELSTAHPDRALQLHRAERGLTGRWDARRIEQMIANLVSNAIQHGRPDAPVTVSASASGQGVELSVHNLGRAIPPEALPTLFDPVARGAVRTGDGREGSSGLGLGLYIARQIAVAHGGSIEASSNDDEGTTFRVRLPRDREGAGTGDAGLH